VILAKV